MACCRIGHNLVMNNNNSKNFYEVEGAAPRLGVVVMSPVVVKPSLGVWSGYLGHCQFWPRSVIQSP